MEIHTIGIDLGKTLFHLVGVDSSGSVVVRKRCSRSQLLAFTANLRVQRIGMEACSGSHFLGRALRNQGHDVRLMPAQYVKPYVKTNKSNYIDAEAIAEAVQRPTMRFVPIKTEDQLDLQAVHRVRERWVMRRTAVVNQIRGDSQTAKLINRGKTETQCCTAWTYRLLRRAANRAVSGGNAGLYNDVRSFQSLGKIGLR
jgi:transposase